MVGSGTNHRHSIMTFSDLDGSSEEFQQMPPSAEAAPGIASVSIPDTLAMLLSLIRPLAKKLLRFWVQHGIHASTLMKLRTATGG